MIIRLVVGCVCIAALACGKPVYLEKGERLPSPDLSRVGPSVQREIQKRISELERRIAQGGPASRVGDAFGGLGMIYHAYSFRPEARFCYEKAVAFTPNPFKWHYFLARILELQTELDAAHDQFERVLDLSAQHVPSLVASAEYFRLKYELDASESRFERALVLEGGRLPALIGLTQIALARGENQKARAFLEKGLAAQPQNRDLNYLAVVLYRRLDDLARAETHASRHSQASPTALFEDALMDEIHVLELSAQELLTRADTALDQGRIGEALSLYEQSVGVNPNLHESRVKFAYALSQGGQLEKALEQYRESLRLNAGTAVVHYNIGGLLVGLKRNPQAVESFQSALRLDPGLNEARLSLADVLRRQDQFEEAINHYQKVVAARPEDTAARLGRALCLIRLARYTEAVAGLEEDIAAIPGESVFPHVLARVLAACPEDDVRDGLKAARLLEPLVKGPPSADLAESVAMAMAETGRFDLAVQWQNRAIKAARDSGQIQKEPFLRERLQYYEAGRPSRSPWRKDDPLFYQMTYRRVLP